MRTRERVRAHGHVAAVYGTHTHADTHLGRGGARFHARVRVCFSLLQLTLSARSRRALSNPSQFGRLPLHVAVTNQASAEVVQLLLNKHRDGAKATDKVCYAAVP